MLIVDNIEYTRRDILKKGKPINTLLVLLRKCNNEYN